jgi:DNA-binding PadR family transcriptional regulator
MKGKVRGDLVVLLMLYKHGPMGVHVINEKLKEHPVTADETAMQWLLILEDDRFVISNLVSSPEGSGVVRVFRVTDLGKEEAERSVSILGQFILTPVLM